MNRQSADELDQADLIQENERQAGLDAVRRKLVEQHPDFNGTDCIDCGDPLPAVRLAYKRVRCTLCQVEVENRDKMRRRA